MHIADMLVPGHHGMANTWAEQIESMLTFFTDIRNPQNAAWLAGFRYAKKKVFVYVYSGVTDDAHNSQTPTLNARPIVRAIKQACRRGVEVVLLLDLGEPH